jgi:hypothetical protein
MAHKHDTRLHLPKLVLPRQHQTKPRRPQLRILHHTHQHKNIPNHPMQRSSQIGHIRRHSPLHAHPTINQLASDPYTDTTTSSWQGLPMNGWNTAPQNFLNTAGYANNEQAFWQWCWSDMATTLKNCPNAIFEAWNEPGWNGADNEALPTNYMSYLQTMYSAIRNTGSTNLIFMQWRMGWQPNGYGATLAWAGQINNALHPTNLAYTTHFYYYAPTDLSAY